jgi:hypothetical protein
VFKTKSGEVLQLNAKQQQHGERDKDGSDDEEHPQILPDRSAQSANVLRQFSSSSSPEVPVASFSRSSSFHPRSNVSGAPVHRLERMASCPAIDLNLADSGCDAELPKADVLEGFHEEEQSWEDHDEKDWAVAEGGEASCDAGAFTVEMQKEAEGVSEVDVSAWKEDSESWVDFLMNYVPACGQLQVGVVCCVLCDCNHILVMFGSLMLCAKC